MEERPRPISAVMWGTYDTGKPRTRILLAGLRAAGVSVAECHADVWGDVEDKSRIHGRSARLKYLMRWLSAYPRLLYRYVRTPKHDLVMIGYWGQLDVLLIWPLARLRGAKIVWDPLLSLYNTLVEHRGWLSDRGVAARLIYGLEWLGCRCADLLVLNTKRGAGYFVATFRLREDRARQVFLGAETDLFAHRGPFRQPLARGERLRVLFFGTFLPAHSVETIVAAARLPSSVAIDWVIVGEGQEAAAMEADLQSNPVPNLHRVRWVDYAELPRWIAEAHLCLGHFGDNEIAAWAIPNKTYQILATGTPLLTRDGPGIRELVGGSEAGAALGAGLYLVPPKEPQAIVAAIERFVADWPDLAGQRLHEDLIASFEPAAFGRNYRMLLEELLGRSAQAPSRAPSPQPARGRESGGLSR